MNKKELMEFIKDTSCKIDNINFHNDCTMCGMRQNRREWNVKSYLGLDDLVYKDNVYSYNQKCKSCKKDYSVNFTKEFIHEQIILTCVENFIKHSNSNLIDSTAISYRDKYLNLKIDDERKNIF